MTKIKKKPFRHGTKRITSIVLAVMMIVGIFTALPLTVGAAETSNNKTQSIEGQCGDNVVYQYDSGVLTISGTGEMANYYGQSDRTSNAPWWSYKNSITSVIIEDGVTSIGWGAFYGFTNMTSITIPQSVQTVYSFAFANCNKLENIYVDNLATYCNLNVKIHTGSSTYWGAASFSNSSPKRIAHNLYVNNELITDANFPNGTTSIANNAFINCSSLTSVTIPNSVISIGVSAFCNCINLTNVVISNNSSLTSVGASAFYNCTALSTKPNIPQNCTMGNNVYEGCPFAQYMCGNNATWNYDNGTLTISGTGPITNYGWYANSSSKLPPWYTDYKTNITNVVIENGITSIGTYAFQCCSKLETITIPNSVTSIGKGAFYSCSDLDHIIIPSGIQIISDSAFSNCSGLTSISIPDSVKSIENYAFTYCSNLATVTISNNSQLQSIGGYAFSDCINLNTKPNYPAGCTIGTYAFNNCGFLKKQLGDNITCSLNNGVLTISGTGKMYDCVSPDNINEYISENRENISSVVIEDGITSIGNYEFYGCSNLISVTIPNSVTSIGNGAFMNTGITSLPNIPENCKLGMNAFKGDNFGVCGEHVFWNYNTDTNTLTFSGNGRMFDECWSPWSQHYNTLENIIVDDGVTGICKNAFSKISVDEKQGNKWVTVYKNYNNLKKVTYADTLSFVGRGAFDGCPSFDVYIDNLSKWCSKNFDTYRQDSPFYKCKNLYVDNQLSNDLVIPSNVTSIGSYAFWNCWALTSVTIPNSVTSVANDAFLYCDNLSGVYISDLSSWLNISFTNVASNPLNYAHNLYLNNELITNLVIPNTVNTIKNYSFVNCTSFEIVTIPNSVTSIGKYAFYGCTGLTSITIPTSVTSLGTGIFEGCTSLTSIPVFNENITSIPDNAFTNCTGLASVTIPNSVTSIGNYAFNGCTGLTNVTIPNSVTSIGGSAFYGCTGLTNVTIPDSVITMGGNSFTGVFQSCVNLTNVVMNGGQLRENTFKDCNNLTSVTIGENVQFDNSVGIYNNNTAFKNCTSLTSLVVNSNEICKEAFWGCTGLKSLTIGENVTTIGASAFKGCTSLPSVIIPENVISLAQGCFEDCTEIQSIIIDDATDIGNLAFYNCSNANIVLSENISSVGYYAFYNTNMIICPINSFVYNSLTSSNFTKYRNSSVAVVGIVSTPRQLTTVLRHKANKATQSKDKISTGASAKNSTGEDIVEEVLTPEQIAENLSHVQCYVVEDLDVDETLTFDSDLDVTLHLNDFETDSKGNVKVDNNGKIVDGEPHTLTASTRDAMIEVPGNGKLTIEATSESNGGLINTKGAVFDVKDGGSLTIKNGTYSEDVSKYTPDNKVMGKTNGLYTVLNPKTEDMTLDNDERQVIMPNNQDTFARNDLVGVQMRAAEEREYINEGDGQIHTVNVGEGMRFVSVVRSDILRGAKDYGYVIVKATNKDFIDNNKDKLVANGSGCKTVSLKGTKNTLAKSEYSSANLNEGKYKYLTTAVTGIKNDNDAVGVRFYIKRADGTYVYADYTCCATMGMIKAA